MFTASGLCLGRGINRVWGVYRVRATDNDMREITSGSAKTIRPANPQSVHRQSVTTAHSPGGVDHQRARVDHICSLTPL